MIRSRYEIYEIIVYSTKNSFLFIYLLFLLKVIYDDVVKEIRPFILCCIVENVNLNNGKLRKFLQLQTKLHDTICAKREKSAIATHDFNKLPVHLPGGQFIRYTAKEPNQLQIHPLGKLKKVTAKKLYDNLKAEAEALRKEKKRNVYSGIHKYLYLLENKDKFSCIEDSIGNVICLPPLTNGETTKVGLAIHYKIFHMNCANDDFIDS